MSLRIIAGDRRGAVLKSPEGMATRPTLSRVRESLFMILAPRLQEARVLDCFAGCGGLGLEALSRGAACAVFIENDPKALAALQANIRKLRYEDRAAVQASDVFKSLESPPAGQKPFDLILLDPPYGRGDCAQCMERLGAATGLWLAEDGLVVAQFGRSESLADSYGPLHSIRQKVLGQTRLAFFTY